MNRQPNSELRGPWGVWHTLGFTLLIAVIVLIVQNLILRPVSDIGDNWNKLVTLDDRALYISIALISSAVITILLVYTFCLLRRGPSIRNYLALNRVPLLETMKWLGVLFAVMVIFYVLEYYGQNNEDIDELSHILSQADSPWLLIISIAFVAPVYEELLFRGFLFEGLYKSRIGLGRAIIVTSVLFALMHFQYSLLQMLIVFVLGILLVLAKLRTNSLYIPILMHSTNNIVAILHIRNGF